MTLSYDAFSFLVLITNNPKIKKNGVIISFDLG